MPAAPVAMAPPQAAAPPAPRAEEPVILARTDDFVIVRARTGDTYASLAERFLRNASLGDFIADANGAAAPAPGRLVIVPLKAFNESGVFADGYQTVPILCYHQFANGRSTDRMIVPRELFVAQMEYLKNNNYNVITLADLEGFLKASRPIPPRSVVITVDDGFRSAYDIAYPILKTYGFRATFFIYTDFLGGGRSLSWAAIDEMRAGGMIDIQSHSKSHASFTPAEGENEQNAAYVARLRAEIDPPQAMLERQLGGRVRSFAYPYGDTSRLAVRLLSERDYSLAVTVERGGQRLVQPSAPAAAGHDLWRRHDGRLPALFARLHAGRPQMKRARSAVLGILPLGLLAACAGMPMEVAAPPSMPAPAPSPVAPVVAPDTARAQFIAQQRAEARRLEAAGGLSRARQHWRYVLALAPDDAETRQQIARLDATIRTRRDAALAQGEAAMMRGQTAAAQTAFLRVLALDGANDQARRRLIELETRAAFARQDRKDASARAARAYGTESPEDDQP